MALQPQTAYFPFAKGQDSKTDPKQVVPGKLLQIQNGFYQTPQMIRKRFGFNALPSGPSAALGLSSYQSNCATFDGFRVWTEAPAMAAAQAAAGFYEPLSATMQSLFHNQLAISNCDMNYHSSGLQVGMWTGGIGFGSGLPFYSVMDTTTGTLVASAVPLPFTSIGPSTFKVLVLGSSIVFIYPDNGVLAFCHASVSSPGTVSGLATLASDFGSAGIFDATVINGKIYVTYSNSHAGGGISIRSMDSSFTISSALQVNGEAPSEALTICGDQGNNVWVTYYNGTLLKSFAYDSTLSVNTFPIVTVSNVAHIYSATAIGGSSGNISISFLALASNDVRLPVVYFNSIAAGTPNVAALVIRSLYLAGKIFKQGTNYYALTVYQPGSQSTYFLLDLTAKIVVAKFLASATSWNFTLGFPLSEAPSPASGSYLFPLLQVDQTTPKGPTPTATTLRNGLEIGKVVFGSTVQAVEIANSLHLSGGFPSLFDGASVTEHGFHLFPEAPTLSTSAGTGLAAGTYQYVAVYEWVDGQGQLHRSAPSFTSSITMSGASNVSVAISTLRVTQKTGVNIAIYRTTGTGTVFFRVNPMDDPLANDPTVDSVTYIDSKPDATIDVQEQLYTTGGQVENAAAPATRAMCAYKSRLIVIPSDSPYSYWYSQQVIPSEGQQPGTPVELSAFFVENVDPKGGPLSNGIQMDDKLILFKETTLGYVVGDGPAPNGTSDDFTPWQQIASDVGSLMGTPVVLTPIGVMFQSAKGISLLDRGLGTSYIGAGVEAQVQGNKVTAAVLYPTYNQVRFTLSSGVAIVFDYLVQEWTVYTNMAAVGACLYQGAFTYATSSGTRLQESASVFSDNGTFYPLLVQTSWLSFAGIQGYQRVREFEVLGDWKSAHTLEVQVAYDMDPTVVQTTNIAAASSVVPYQWRVLLDRQKCESVQITLQDSQSGPYGEGLDLSGLAFEIGVKGKLNRLPNTQTKR